MLKGVIFDVDGTLLDTMQMWDNVHSIYLKSLGKIPDPTLAEAVFDMTLEESSEYIKKRYDLSGTVAEVKAGVLKVVEVFYKYEALPKRGVTDFLNTLREKSIPMIVASSSDKNQILSAFSRLGIADYFIDVLTCTELGKSKRNGEIYKIAAERLGTDISETVVFEDVYFAVNSAKEAGFYVVAVEDEASINDREEIKNTADRYIKDFTEIDIDEQL